MQLFAVKVNRDDTVKVVAVEVAKVTPQFYVREDFGDWNDDRRGAFPWSKRIPKESAFLTDRAALQAYMARRQEQKAIAQAVVGQATKQIASANELLMHLPEEPQAVAAVDPHVDSTGKLTTRDANS